MEAQVGDEIIVGSSDPGVPGRVAIVVAVSTGEGSARYKLHGWLAGDYDAMVSPGPRTGIEILHKAHPGALAAIDDQH